MRARAAITFLEINHSDLESVTGGDGMSVASAASVPRIVKKSLTWSIVLSILMIVAGLLSIIVPPIAGIVVTVFIGWLLVFSAGAHFVFAWHARATRGAIWEVLVGILYLLVGGYMLINPVLGIVSLTFAMAVYFVMEAVLEFVLSFRLRPMPGSGWLLFDGIVTAILAVIIFATWPLSSAWALGTLAGISMLFSGVARLMLSLAARRAVTELT
jgi:uncharacterized membrane protein HdeD (DUF308 family)